MMLAMVDSSSGAACALGDEPGDHLGSGRQDQDATHDRLDPV
jgi:hypothetical protein